MKNINKTFNLLLLSIASLIVGISILLFISTGNASELPYFSKSDPAFSLKYGMWPKTENPNNAGKTNAFTLEAEAGDCIKYKLCYNASFIYIVNNDGENAGLGVDVKYNMFKRANDRLYVAVGVTEFSRPLNGGDGRQLNLHTAVGVEFNKFIVSFDSYGFGKRVPTYLINVGGRF